MISTCVLWVGKKTKYKGLLTLSKFTYKPQYAVVVMCNNEKEQELIYNQLKEEGHKLKVVSV